MIKQVFINLRRVHIKKTYNIEAILLNTTLSFNDKIKLISKSSSSILLLYPDTGLTITEQRLFFKDIRKNVFSL